MRTFAAAPDALALADAFLIEFGSDHGIGGPAVFRARVCVAELAANILEHGGARAETDSFTLTVCWDGGSILDLEFSDTSKPFDPTRREAIRTNAGSDDAGGRGLRLMQGLATRSRYHHDGKANHVQLQFLVTADTPQP